MSIEDAKNKLQSEREAYVRAHLTDPSSRKLRRRIQNRINQRVSRWNKFFYLETAEDHHKLAREIEDMREGRSRRPREGRPRRIDDRSSRRTSKRLAEQRRKPEDVGASEEETLSDSAVVFDLPPSANDVNISTEPTTICSSITSSCGEFVHSISNEIGGTPDRISGGFFDLPDSQNFSQYSNLPSLADETWYNFDDMYNPVSISGTLPSGTNMGGDGWLEFPQPDMCDDNPMGSEWPDDLVSFSASHILSANGDSSSGTNILEAEPHLSVVPPNGLVIAPQEDLDLHNAIPSMSRNVDGCTQTRSPEVPLRREKVNSGFVLTGQPALVEPQDMATLIDQCLTVLRGRTSYMSKIETNGNVLQNRRPIQKYETTLGLQITVDYLWNAVRR